MGANCTRLEIRIDLKLAPGSQWALGIPLIECLAVCGNFLGPWGHNAQ